MNFAENFYGYNSDGSVRAEFITKENGVIPVSYFAHLFKVDLVDAFHWNKKAFRGFLLDVSHVNDEGIKCDADGNPLENEKFQALPNKFPEVWGQRCWVNRTGDRVLSDEQKFALPADQQSDFRCLRCMEVRPASDQYDGEAIYVTEEATSVLAAVLRADVLIGDPINRRYQYECQHDEDFANKFGFALKEGQERLQEKIEESRFISHMASHLAHELFSAIMGDDDSDEKEANQSEEETDGPNQTEHGSEEAEA